MVEITDHAIIRYLERVKGIDMDTVRAEMTNPATEIATSFGCPVVILSGGCRAIVRDGQVRTVLPRRRGAGR